jgi:PAS domain S-box-containing protein
MKRVNFKLLLLVIAAVFVAFVVHHQNTMRSTVQGYVDSSANTIALSVWNLNDQNNLAYLKTEAEQHNYESIQVFLNGDKKFLEVVATPGNKLENALASAGFYPVMQTRSEIMYHDEKLGTLIVRWRSTAIYTYAYYALTAILLLIVARLYNRIVTAKETLESTVEKRTAELLESQAKYRMFADNVSEVLWALDGDLKPTFYSPSIKAQRGWTPEEAIRQGLNEMHPEKAVAHFKKSLIDPRHDVEAEPLDLEMRRKDGSTFWGRITFTVLRDPDGKITGVVGITRDVTQLRRAERILLEYKLCVESTDELVVVLDSDYRIVLANKAFMKLREPGEVVVGEKLPAIIGENIFNEKLKKQFDRCFAGQQNAFETETDRPDKNNLILLLKCVPMPAGEDEGIKQIAIVGHDITEAKRDEKSRLALETHLAQAQKMEAIGTLAGGIAHDFNNILSAIIGYSELSLPGVKGNPEVADNINEILNAGKRAKALVKQILTFARETKQAKNPTQLSLIAKEVVKLLRASIPTSIEIRQDIKSDALTMGDPSQLYQILMNLCTNASLAMPDGGVLEVALDELGIDESRAIHKPGMVPGDFLRLKVRDSGVGMPDHVKQRIFDPFFTTRGEATGTGMGLSVVHGIVEDYGGTITVESQPGQGSTFYVYFPISHLTENMGDLSDADFIAGGNESVLLVDDEASMVRVCQKILERKGYRVTGETSSMKALELFKEDPDAFDLVVTDMTMPEMTGDVLARHIMMIKPGIPVVMCTGYSEKIDEETAKALGIKELLLKPLEQNTLLSSIRIALGDEE